jgi:hypothetical protein
MNEKRPVGKWPAMVIPLSVTFLISCGIESDLSQQLQPNIVTNGFTVNGFTVNGFTVNGFTVNGLTLNNISVSGVSTERFDLNGEPVSGLSLSGSQFRGTTATGKSVSGLDFTGGLAQVRVAASGAVTADRYTLRFDRIYVDPELPDSDVYLYDVSYARSESVTWQSLCTDSNGTPVPAVPIANYWNEKTGDRIDNANVITFACISGALGKCVRLGYRPWAQVSNCTTRDCSQVLLNNHHQACTRLIRADYCGTGKSYTLNGTFIELYDALNPQIQRQTMKWNIEARWTAEKAECIGDARHAELLSNGRSPDCDSDGIPDRFPRCGSDSRLTTALLGSTFDSN